ESDLLQCAAEWLAEDPDERGHTAPELAQLVGWGALPDPPHLHLPLGSRHHARALGLLLAARAAQHASAHPHHQQHGQQHHEQQQHQDRPHDDRPQQHRYSPTHSLLGRGGPAGAPGPRHSAAEPPAIQHLWRLLAQLQAAAALPHAPHLGGAAHPPSTGPLPTSPRLAAPSHSEDWAASAADRRSDGASTSRHASGLLGAAGRRAGGAATVSAATGGRPRRHLASRLLAVGGHDSSWRAVKAVELYDPHTDQWESSGPSLLQGLSFAGCAFLPGGGGGGGAVYLVGGTPLLSSVWRLRWGTDGSVGRAWEMCAGLLVPRAHAGVVAVAGSLVVLGGRSQVQQGNRRMGLRTSPVTCTTNRSMNAWLAAVPAGSCRLLPRLPPAAAAAACAAATCASTAVVCHALLGSAPLRCSRSMVAVVLPQEEELRMMWVPRPEEAASAVVAEEAREEGGEASSAAPQPSSSEPSPAPSSAPSSSPSSTKLSAAPAPGGLAATPLAA
ncbi:hypothetical protein TSOC_014172, partial [Tetrabaena socialis]